MLEQLALSLVSDGTVPSSHFESKSSRLDLLNAGIFRRL